MRHDYDSRSLKERFDHLLKVIASDRFLQKMGLGNEVPFFICPFDPNEGYEMQKLVQNLTQKLQKQGVSALEVNLYDLAIDLLRERGIFDQILEEEQEYEKPELQELLQGVLDPEVHVVPAIADRMRQSRFDVLFITGVGEVYPYIRSHSILNNLQKEAKEQPTVMFFPGKYTQTLSSGASLDLFGRLHNDKYYRAFNIYHYET